MKRKGLLLILLTLVCLFFVTVSLPSVSAAEEDGVFTKIATTSELTVGDKVVFGYDNVGMGTLSTTSTTYGTKQAVTIDGNLMTSTGSALVLTVVAGSKEGTFAFKTTAGKYISWTSGNSLAHSTAVNANSSWTVDVASGNATITNVSDTTRILQYNASSPRFACYTGTQQPINIYKLKVVTLWDELSGEFNYYYNDGEYKKYTQINININNEEVAEELDGLVHAYNTTATIAKEKTTTYKGNSLYFDNGRGYGTSEDGTKLTTLSYNSETKKYEVISTHDLPGMEAYYCTLNDFYLGTHSSSHVNGEELDLVSGWSYDENTGVYTCLAEENADVIAAFVLFTAPTWLDLGSEYNNYLRYTKATVEINAEGNLEMKLWVSATEVGIDETTGKLDLDSEIKGTDAVFSVATIYDHKISEANKVAEFLEEYKNEEHLINDDFDLSTVVTGYKDVKVEWSGDGVEDNVLTYLKPEVDTDVYLTATITVGHQVRVVENIKFTHLLKEDTGFEEKEYSYTFVKSVYTKNNSTKTLNNVSWALAGTGMTTNSFNFDNNNGRGFQFGSGSSGKAFRTMTLTSESFSNVTTIKINTSGASKTTGKLIVTVGGVQIGSQISLTTTATEYTFTAPTALTGEIVLSYTQTSDKAIYIKSITVVYGE